MEAGAESSADLTRLAYEGVLRKEAWREFLALACEAFRSKDSYLASFPIRSSGPRFLLTHGVDPKVAETYRERWIAPPQNPILNRLAPRRFRGVIEPRDVVPRSEFEKTEFFEICRRPRGVDAELGCGDVVTGGRIRFFTVNRARGDAPFGDLDRKLMEFLCPHLLKALEVDALLAAEREQGACLGCVVRSLDDPVIRRDPDGRLRPLNPAGEDFLRLEGFGTWDGSAFLPRDPRPTILERAASPSERSSWAEKRFRTGRTWKVFSIPCFESDRYAGEVLRLRLAHPCRLSGELPEPQADLTPQELSIANLLSEGLSSREICARLGITTNTLNTHVRHVLGKIGCHSRTQLVARLGGMAQDEVDPGRVPGRSVYRD